MNSNILVIGAGTMGFVIIKELVDTGYEVLVCDIDALKVERAIAAGAVRVSTPSEGANNANI